MGLVGKVAKILGPRGLVPNKKTGTVTFDVGSVVSDLKKDDYSLRMIKMELFIFHLASVI